MNEREQLARLKEQQARLELELSRLSAQLNRIEQALNQPQAEPVPLAPPPIPPVISAVPPPPTVPLEAPSIPRFELKAPIPAPSSPIPAAPVAPAPEPLKLRLERPTVASTAAPAQTPTPPPVPPPIPRSVPSAGPRPQSQSFEMRLGTFWFVRIGVVLVLTALVFFGHLAYERYISQLGPGGKVALLYVASFLLLAAGWWWQRQAVKDSLKNYAQVLFAGGLAALYFTTYAAHHIQPLQVIKSAVTDGFLLLLCAGAMVWTADRKKSEVLAMFAVGLAYYTSIITRVGYFTLYSNLVLTLAAVMFLVRNRWAILSFGSLIASYAAYGFWRFFDGTNWHWAAPGEGLWSGTYFLISYWIVFTAAVFLSRERAVAGGEKPEAIAAATPAALPGESRAGFLTLNNGAFFTMFLLTMLHVNQGGFWKFALVYGGVLLGLSIAAAVALPAEPLTHNGYLTQGLLLVTVGFISKFAGLQLALILAAESVVLLTIGQRQKRLVLLVGAYIAAALAVAWSIDGMQEAEPSGVWLALGLGVMMLANTVIAHRQIATVTDPLLRPQPAYFTVLTLVACVAATWNNVSHEHFPLFAAAEGLVLTLSFYALRVREVPLLSQGCVILAQLVWFVHWLDHQSPLPWWDPALLIAISLFLAHWWQHQKAIRVTAEFGLIWQAVYALMLIELLYCWIRPNVEAPGWLALSSLLAVGLTAYGVVTRAWLLAACAQIYVLMSSGQFAWQLWQAKPHWYFPLAPLAALILLSWSTGQWFAAKPEADARVREPLLQLARLYRWVALVMSIWWVCEYAPARERIWLLALLGLWAFLWSGLRRNREALLFSAAFTGVALVLFWLPLIETPAVYWPNLLVLITLLAQRQIARRLPDRYPQDSGLHTTVILIGGISLWRFLSLWVGELEDARGGSYMTASWSLLALALFTTGIALRERMYRWLGLGILGCALGRVVIFDVWKLETLYRILSFMALGMVLLVLGFIYNKYQEKIREWL